MNSFTFYNPTQLVFGKDSIEKLPAMINQFTSGTKVLITYGGGSIKRTGLYDRVIGLLEGFEVFELEGIEPNPRLSTVKKGVQLVKDNNIDFILAIGGGSVIDGTKLISAASTIDEDPWKIVTREVTPTAAVPFGTILTIAATGSEMNSGSVITNWETNEKLGWGSPLVFPKFSLLNPEVTYTLPKNQTVNGIVDSMSHLLEQYFNEADNSAVGDAMIAGVMKAIMKAGLAVQDEPENYEARETLMIGATVALNGFMRMGYNGDWATHNIEHAVSAVHDIAHGAGLAVLFPAWMTYVSGKSPERFAQFAEDVFDVDASLPQEEKVKAGIAGITDYWKAIGAPSSLSEFDIPESDFEVFADKTLFNGPFGNFYKLNKEDVIEIYKLAH
ncbi:iron-containing alcohol dehydrogenase [Macrococcus equipercicus]|uniref:Iron-containing alcohol dehydrogenase n=1 Tax=Macrococcus equipercicus TaxID=69967 RepID=A0A9Q9F246_9STAP|nr:iron-containing alcohol dehydrogenase [Macrococcus equipercicus]KAA1042565.1 iron-containing alcohol dehydrogenase [Macrococcus equipercicus]UTH14425.1 iron-containing alcohol dehydrogenase [Macrococcus equipercicus]